MPLLLNENAPIDAAIFLVKAAVGGALLLGLLLRYAARQKPAASPPDEPPGRWLPWVLLWGGLAAAAYLLYLVARLLGG